MNWTTSRDLKTQLARRWERGELLRDVAAGITRFPLRLTLRRPTATELTTHFEAVREWVQELSACPWLQIEWQETHHRIQGTQRMPAAARVDSLEHALAWLGRQHDHARYVAMLTLTRDHAPTLIPWLARRPLKALELEGDWGRLLTIVAWLVQHPRPAIFLRQVDLSGVHSKFIEAHRAVLAELLDLALPASDIDPSASCVSGFAQRYGFRDKPVRVRFRSLDPGLAILPALPAADLTLDAASFSRLQPPCQRVLITENEINFLSLPDSRGTLALFGAGYGWEALARADWLHRCQIYYWGDLDTHGYAILDRLRSHFPSVISLLMDRATLQAHTELWGHEETPTRENLKHLTPDEQALYDDLRYDRIRPGLRLEQEHLGYEWVCRQILSKMPEPGAGGRTTR